MAKKVPSKDYLISLLWFLIPALVCIYVYHNFKSALPKRLSDQVQLTGSLATQDFKRTVRSNVQGIQNLAERIEETNGDYYDYWIQDAKRLLKQNESLDFVELINPKGIVEDIFPRRPNVPAIGLDISKLAYRYEDWQSKSSQGVTNITQWVQLSQGGNSFLVDVPVYIEDEFKGTVTGGMNFNDEFDRLSYYLKDFAIQIKDEEGTRFYNYNNYDQAQTDPFYVFETAMIMDSDMNESWNFQLTFANPDFLAENMRLADYALGVGLILSLAIGLLSFFNRNAQNAASRTLRMNKKLKELNLSLEEQTLKANQASIAKTEFLSNMSHEIRTPLNAIVGISDLIGSGNNKFEEEHYLSLLKQSSKTLLNLINDILRLDKMESGFSEVAHIEFCPLNIIENLRQFNLQPVKSKDLDLEVVVDTKTKSYVLGDRAKFEQILNNIVSNAIKFTQKGKIAIHYSERQENNKVAVEIRVTDTGIGIPEDKINDIFDRFIQLDTGMRKKHSGGGIGLSIVKHLVELLGGTISVKSKVGEGSEFKINLDFDLLSKKKIDQDQLTAVDIPELNILAVDDNKLNVIVLSQLLKKIGLETDIAYNGEEAVDKAHQKKYDLIFMDVHMPDIDGYEATRRIKQLYKDTIILGLSADSTISAVDSGLKCGMSDYLTKPIDKNKLTTVLNDHFGSKTKDVI